MTRSNIKPCRSFNLMMQAANDIHRRLYGGLPIETSDAEQQVDPAAVTSSYLYDQLEMTVNVDGLERSQLKRPGSRRSSLEGLAQAVGFSTEILDSILRQEALNHGYVATVTIAVIKRLLSIDGARQFSLNELSSTRISDLPFWRMINSVGRNAHPLQILGAFAHHDAEVEVGRPIYKAEFRPLVESVRAEMAA